MRVALAGALFIEPDLLMLDEVNAQILFSCFFVIEIICLMIALFQVAYISTNFYRLLCFLHYPHTF